MTVSIFGATGMVGKRLVHQALNKGHKVIAFGRNVYNTDFHSSDKLELVQGALFDEKQVYDALANSDAVLSVLGGAVDGTDKTRSLGMKNIVEQMQKAGVQRIIAVGGLGCLNLEDDQDIIMNTPSYPKAFLPVGREHYKAFEYLKDSNLSWTFVCPPDLIDAEPTGIYYTKANYLPSPNNNRINTGDLALFMLAELDKNEFLHQRVGISN
jgi:uncharacterized protein